ncbi:MAG: GcrA family cell cycle regulator [Geminicoccaceae bacterium]
MSKTPSPWTPELERRLAFLWVRGDHLRRIARDLGLTPGQVAGKRKRMGLAPRPDPVKKVKPLERKESKLHAAIIPGIAAGQVSNLPERHRPSGLLEPFTSAGSRCQWIEGKPTPEDDCKCGAPVMRGKPYCEAHWAKAWRKAEVFTYA